MSTTTFDRDAMAQWYATEHLKTDPGIATVWYLPTGAGEREVRLVEVNELMAERTDDSLEPIDFGVDMGTDTEHKLLVVDITPDQWDRLKSGGVSLPDGWSLDAAISYTK